MYLYHNYAYNLIITKTTSIIYYYHLIYPNILYTIV
nr:MAG TPA: hypothetical protein [Caudoviricetes sp.]